MPPLASKSAPAGLLVPVCAGLVWALLNAFKPLTIDDPFYYFFSSHFAAHPFDPFGFDFFWMREPEWAFYHVSAPPVLPYWLALGRSLLPDDPFFWKLWLLPFALLFTGSLYALLRRFAPGTETPVVLLTALSPAFLTSFNMVLDVPAQAMSVTAVALFVRACDRRSLAGTLLAGLFAGLAMQTKYTGVLASSAILLYALMHRRLGLGILAGAAAAGVFLSWDGLMAYAYGKSYFFSQLRGRGAYAPRRPDQLFWMGTYLGGLAPAVALLGLTALGVRRWLVTAVGAVIVAGFVALAVVPGEWTVWLRKANGTPRLTLSGCVFGLAGLLTGVVAAGLVLRTVCLRPSWQAFLHRPDRRDALFLVGWLGVEGLGYFPLTPFGASRRVLGLQVVLTLLAAYLAARTCRSAERRGLIRAIVVGSVALALLYDATDWRDAQVEREAVEKVAEWLHQQPPAGDVWYVGHWGFQYYAHRAGMRQLVPEPAPNATEPATYTGSTLHRGDWLVVPGKPVDQQPFNDADAYWAARPLELVQTFSFNDPIPLRTVPTLYGGAVPMQHRDLAEPRLTIRVYRVLRDFVPPPPPPEP